MGFTDVDRLAINTIRVLAVSSFLQFTLDFTFFYWELPRGRSDTLESSFKPQFNIKILKPSTDILSSRPMLHSNLTLVIPEPLCEFLQSRHNKIGLLMKYLGEWHQLPTFFSTRSWTSTQRTQAGLIAIDSFFRKSYNHFPIQLNSLRYASMPFHILLPTVYLKRQSFIREVINVILCGKITCGMTWFLHLWYFQRSFELKFEL